MKRTNLMLDADLVEKALRLSGERTYSAVVNRALEDLVRRMNARRILDLEGSGVWEDNLSEMRRDRPAGRRRARGPRVPR
jgi:Arc/MetJ family transcription regulator